MKMREYTEREHKVKQHPLESPGHQKVKPGLPPSLPPSLSLSLSPSHTNTGSQSRNECWRTFEPVDVYLLYLSAFLTSMQTTDDG